MGEGGFHGFTTFTWNSERFAEAQYHKSNSARRSLYFA
jgi:hypothetical protein